MTDSTGAKAVIRNGKIEISIDVDALPVIVSGSCCFSGGLLGGLWKVTDAAVFAKEVCSSLNREREDGTTRVHIMFDEAFEHAIDQGAEGIESVTEAEFEAETRRLREEAPPNATTPASQPDFSDLRALRERLEKIYDATDYPASTHVSVTKPDAQALIALLDALEGRR